MIDIQENIYFSGKYHVFMRRVSTNQQDIKSQILADEIYRSLIPDHLILIMEEKGVSANKLRYHEREKMKELIRLIKADKVDTVYAFDRTRLFRKFLDAMLFFDLCKKHKVKIIYTSSEHIQSTNRALLEGILFVFAEEDGKNIARKSSEVRRAYPAQKYGYVRSEDKKRYIYNPDKKETILLLFEKLQLVKSEEEFLELVKTANKQFKLNPKKFLSIIRDPFYAAHDLINKKVKLNHVDPYITLNKYNQIQKIITPYFDNLFKKLQELDAILPISVPVICGVCHKTLKLKKNFSTLEAFYSCSHKNKDQKIVMSHSELSINILEVLPSLVERLDYKKYISDSKKTSNFLNKQLDTELSKITPKLTDIMDKIILDLDVLPEEWMNHELYPLYTKYSAQKTEVEKMLDLQDELYKQVLYLTKLVKKEIAFYLEKDFLEYSSLFFKKIILYKDDVVYETNAANYYTDLPSQLSVNK